MRRTSRTKQRGKLTATEDKPGHPSLSAEAQNGHPSLSAEAQNGHNPQKEPFAKRMFAGKALWDWIELAIKIVGALAVLLTLPSLIVNVQQFKEQQRSENERTLQQQRSEQARSLDQQQQTTLERAQPDPKS